MEQTALSHLPHTATRLDIKATKKKLTYAVMKTLEIKERIVTNQPLPHIPQSPAYSSLFLLSSVFCK